MSGVSIATGVSALDVFNQSVAQNIVQASLLNPTGNDDSSRIVQYVSDMAASGKPALLGSGDFIVGSPMIWRSKEVLSKWGGQGIGLRVSGQGAGNTRLLWTSASSTDRMITVNAPTAAGIAKRNYLTEIGGMSWIRAPGGVENPQGTVSGNCFSAVPSSAGEVWHTAKLRDIYMDGFQNGITLSDVTLCEIDALWATEFGVAIRAGYNVDLLKVRHSMFGSEQFGASYRNSAIVYQNGFNDGINPVGAYEDCIEFEQVWFMKLGKVFELTSNLGIKGLRVNKCYFEDVKRYLHALGTSGQVNAEFTGCKFSKQTTNDVTQTDPTLANYEAKIQFDGDVAVTGGVTPYLTMEDNIADYVQGANAWVSFNSRIGRIFWKNNYMRSSSSFGHVRCIRNGYATWRTLPNDGVGQWVLGDTDQGGIGLLAGEPVAVTATIAAGATYNISQLSGNHFILTLPDGDCTINSLAYSGTPPSNMVSPQSKVKLTLIVPASVAATRTITWGANMKMNSGTLTYGTADQNKRTTILLEGYAISGNGLQLVSRDPTFI